MGDVYLDGGEFRSRKPLARLGYPLLRNPLVMFCWVRYTCFYRPPLHPAAPANGKHGAWFGLTRHPGLVDAGGFLAGSVLDVIKVLLPAIWLGDDGAWMFASASVRKCLLGAIRNGLRAFGAQGSIISRRASCSSSGNIGFHHIHHLNPRVLNYYLEPAHRRSDRAAHSGFLESLSTPRLMLIDEERANQLIT